MPRDVATLRLANTSGKIFQHIHTECMQDNPALNAVGSFWRNSLRIRTATLDVCCNNELAGCTTPLAVDLVLNVSDTPAVESTTYALSIKVSASCTKVFKFLSGAQIRIPVSSSRPTALTIRVQQQKGSCPALRNTLVDKLGQTQSEFGHLQLQPAQHQCLVYSCLGTVQWKFPCYEYLRDAQETAEDYDMQTLARDFELLSKQGQLLPSYNKLDIVSSTQAELLVQKLESSWHELDKAVQDCRRSSLEAELRVTGADANALMKQVDWQSSYCVPSDTHVKLIYTLAREVFYKLKRTTEVAVDCSWIFGRQPDANSLKMGVRDAVCELLRNRSNMVRSVLPRRQDLQSVVRVRTSFLCISAIDAAARSVCGMTTRCKNSLFKADDIDCHAYWMGQMKGNSNNSVTMSESLYTQATQLLRQCQRVQDTRVVLLPHNKCIVSKLGLNAWQNMHLQGLACRDAFVVASAPHFLYKQKVLIDYNKHPMLSVFNENVPAATQQQVESAKLFAMLVSSDVEHRIITPQTGQHIEQQWKLACQNCSAAREGLSALFEPCVASLITSALDASVPADVSFITNAYVLPPRTGYDTKRLAALEHKHLLDGVLQAKMVRK